MIIFPNEANKLQMVIRLHNGASDTDSTNYYRAFCGDDGVNSLDHKLLLIDGR